MTRDQLVQAGVQAILNRYRPVPDADEQLREAVGVVVDTIGPLIRADEREHVGADLRAQVAALLDPDTSGWAYQDAVIDVLALLDGATDD